VRSLFGSLGDAIALSLCSLCLCGSFKKECLGSWRECDRFWGVEGCDRCFGELRGCDLSFSVSSVSGVVR
jgi:hypothetical protein